MLKKINNHSSRFSKILISFIFVILLIIPFVFTGNYYYLGGDDTRLYYLYPKEFINNFAANIVSDNALGGANTGYTTAGHFIPFVIVILILKTFLPFLSTQMLLYGFNYAFAFLFFYLFVSIWIKGSNYVKFFIKIFSSLFFVSSPFIVATLYNHQLTSIYLVSLMPATLYFFTRAVLEKKYYLSVVVSLFFSIFSTTLNTTPWWLPIVITGIPFFLYLAFLDLKSLFINFIICFIFLLVLNFYWIFHFVNSNISKMSVATSAQYYSSQEYEDANLVGVKNLTRIMHPLVPLLQKHDYRFLQNYSPNMIFNIVFVVVIIFGGIYSKNYKNSSSINIYNVSLASLLISWFMYSPNFGDWGPKYFIKIITTIPFGLMFRNMYDKFALQIAFYFAFSFCIAGLILAEKIKNSSIKYLFLLSFSIPVIFNLINFSHLKVESSGAKGLISGEFNEDFIQLVEYLNKMENQSRYLWLPMTAPNYVNIKDSKSGNYYSGLSPLRIMADKNDYAGRYSFLLPKDVFYGDKIFTLILNRDYDNFAKEIQKLNVRYLILDKQSIPDEMQSYLYDEDRKYLTYQDEEYKRFILGEKIQDFGNNYSLYYINSNYMNDKIFLTDNYESLPKDFSNTEYKKKASYEYVIRVSNLNSLRKIVFLDVYDKNWELFSNSSGTKISDVELFYEWANGWTLDPDELKRKLRNTDYKVNSDGSLDIDLKLYFQPQVINKQLITISLFGYIFSLLIISYCVYKLNFKNKK